MSLPDSDPEDLGPAPARPGPEAQGPPEGFEPGPSAVVGPPEGFEPGSQRIDPGAAEGDRPDWLVGADDGRDFGGAADEAFKIPNVASAPPRSERSAKKSEGTAEADDDLGSPGAGRRFKLERAPEPPSAPAEPSRASEESLVEAEDGAWRQSASSVPKLTVVRSPRARPGSRELPPDDLVTPNVAPPEEELDAEKPAKAPELAIVPPEEPWWLVAIEVLSTNRMLQIGLGVVALVVLALMFWPRPGAQSEALAAIRQHPDRFEGKSVQVRGEVGDVFEIGQGCVFHLVQNRDTVVVFSSTRHPVRHDRLTVRGTVSTGYLDGVPRVAVFEATQ